jgi:hypothetical protein
MNSYTYLEQRMRISFLYHQTTHAATCTLVQNLVASRTCFALTVSPSLESRLLSPPTVRPRTFPFYALTDRTTNYCLEFLMALRFTLTLD